MDLFERVSEDIKNAMKAKDKVALETLRNVKKVFLEAKTAPGANDTLADADALKLLQKLVKQGKDSAAIYVGQGRQDLADAELAQVAVLEKYLPKQMSAEELETELKKIIAEETTKSGIVLPGSEKEKPQMAEVVAVGPGGVVDGKTVTMEVQPGDQVVYAKYAGTEIEVEDEKYMIIKQDDILAILK